MMGIYGVVLAGGRGTRLWPQSTALRPKQFIAFHGEKTLLQQTVAYLDPFIGLTDILVITFREYAWLVRTQLPGLPEDNVIIEPDGCDTTTAVGIVAARLRAIDPGAVMVCVAADLYFGDPQRYRQALAFGTELAAQNHLLVIGIVPQSPETGYGYVQPGERVAEDVNGQAAFRAIAFTSKPPRALAEQFFRERSHLWHSGVSVWRAERILADIHQFVPDTWAFIADLASDATAVGWDRALAECVIRDQDPMAIEASVIQHASDVVVVPLDSAWSDLGTWMRMGTYFSTDTSGNHIQLAPQGHYLALNAYGTIVHSSTAHTIVTVGTTDLIIVQSDDTLLICHKDAADDIGQVLARLPRDITERV